MSNKLDFAAIEQYSKQYATKLCDEFYARHDAINGQQVLNLSNVGQVNTLVVSQLYEKWKSDTERFRSPYFDFEHESVKQALQAFMNTVSQQISIKRAAFEPLLSTAVSDTLVLLLDPKHYFETLLRNVPYATLSADTLKAWGKYTRCNKFIVNSLQEYLGDASHVSVAQALGWLDTICHENAPYEDTEKYLQLFASKVSADKDSFLKKAASKSFFDFEPDDVVVETPIKPTFQPEIPVVTTPVVPTPPPASPVEVKAPVPVLMDELADNQPEILNTKFAGEQQTINDILAKETPGILANKLATGRLESIVGAISLNQKFGFINQLFHGDAVAYTQAVHELEHCMSLDEAQQLINNQYATKYMWRQSPEEAAELMDIVRRRFT
ncbi:MAG: hypothetical protein U0Y10_25185 [Spirosomataceae bacterium]